MRAWPYNCQFCQCFRVSRASYERLYGPLRISFVEMAQGAGGMRIRVGRDFYYGSVSGTLAALEDELQH